MEIMLFKSNHKIYFVNNKVSSITIKSLKGLSVMYEVMVSHTCQLRVDTFIMVKNSKDIQFMHVASFIQLSKSHKEKSAQTASNLLYDLFFFFYMRLFSPVSHLKFHFIYYIIIRFLNLLCKFFRLKKIA